MARYVDDSNYYYLTLRHTNLVSLRKLTNGAITELGTYSLPITLGTWYRLRIEAVGAQIRGFVNGVLVAEATDTTHPARSRGPHHQSRRRGFRRLSRHPALNREKGDIPHFAVTNGS